MEWNLMFFINSVLLGGGLAMDAFSLSLVNGLNEPEMRRRKMCAVASVFALFQAMMPLIGWACVHTVVRYFRSFEKFVPYIALALLLFIGGKMLIEGIKNKNAPRVVTTLGIGTLFVQGIATSIDALSVGFTIADYNALMATVCAAVIAAVTFIICMGGLFIGRKFGTRLSSKANIIGGTILIAIGIEIFVKGVFF